MGERVSAPVVARLLCAAASAALFAAPAFAQQASQQTVPATPVSPDVDPSAPLDPMPDLGVPWPEIGNPPPEMPQAGEVPEPEASVTDTASEHHYAITIAGLERLGNSA